MPRKSRAATKMAPTCYFDDDETKILDHEGKGVGYLGDKENGSVFECRDCGLVFTPKTNPAAYLELYSKPRNYFEASVSIGYKTFEARWNHDYVVSEVRLRNLVANDPLGGCSRVLDIGCGNCALLARLSRYGFQAKGVDLDAFSVNKGLQIAGPHEVRIGDFLDAQFDELFDAVLFTDSFEHFLYPHSCAKHACSLVEKDGLIVVEMPDTDSDGYKMERMAWIHVKPKEHPFLYARRHVEAIFGGFGFVITNAISTIPGRIVYYLRRK